MDCKTLHFSRHAFERMFQRGINPDAVAQIIAEGQVIADYPDDQPFPSVLLLGFYVGQPVQRSLRAIRQREAAIWLQSTCLIPQFGMSH